ncbi:unnamed protein product [Camellia sinensis]
MELRQSLGLIMAKENTAAASPDLLLCSLHYPFLRWRSSRRIVFIGCGTSYNATLAARPILQEFSAICWIGRDQYTEKIQLFVRQSGETANTLHALEYALENGAPCVGITNTVGSAIARNTHCGVHINAGAEIGMASTKAYTSQIVVKAMPASSQARKESIIEGLFELPSKVLEVLKIDQEMKDLSKLLIVEQSLLVFGRGYNYATAFEGALKVKEVALMHSEGIIAGEMKHGPLALVDENLLIVVIDTRDACFRLQQSVIQQLYACKGRLIVMCTKGDTESVIVGIMAYHLTVLQATMLTNLAILQRVLQPNEEGSSHFFLKGYIVDQLHNLGKNVTTE